MAIVHEARRTFRAPSADEPWESNLGRCERGDDAPRRGAESSDAACVCSGQRRPPRAQTRRAPGKTHPPSSGVSETSLSLITERPTGAAASTQPPPLMTPRSVGTSWTARFLGHSSGGIARASTCAKTFDSLSRTLRVSIDAFRRGSRPSQSLPNRSGDAFFIPLNVSHRTIPCFERGDEKHPKKTRRKSSVHHPRCFHPFTRSLRSCDSSLDQSKIRHPHLPALSGVPGPFVSSGRVR